MQRFVIHMCVPAGIPPGYCKANPGSSRAPLRMRRRDRSFWPRFTAIGSRWSTAWIRAPDFSISCFPGMPLPGVYRIIYSDRVDSIRMQNRFVEFIFNRENLELLISSTDLGPVLYFENSTENQVYREFMEFELAYEAQLMSLYPRLGQETGGEETRRCRKHTTGFRGIGSALWIPFHSSIPIFMLCGS